MFKKPTPLIITSGIVVAVIIILLVVPEKPKEITVDPKFKTYVSAFTSGIISKGSTIKVQFQNQYADSAMIGKRAEEQLFVFSPDIKGEARWADPYTLEYRPDQHLQANTLYNAKLHLSKITEVSDEYKTMEFSFRTVQQSLEIQPGNMRFLPGKQLKWLKLDGRVLTADVEDPETIKEVITAEQDGHTLNIQWMTEEASKEFLFEVDSISRKEQESEVKLMWNGKPVSAKQKGEDILPVTPLGIFKVRKVSVSQNPEQSVTVEFSDPLDPDQDLTGLVQIGSIDAQFTIDRNILKIYPRRELKGKNQLRINKGIRNIHGKKLPETSHELLRFDNLKPDIRFKGKGVILPGSRDFILPFEAVNLRAVDITIYKIYEQNILQFLQVNNLDESSQLARVAKVAYKGTIPLNTAEHAVTDFAKWNDFALDMTDLITPDKGAIYRVKLNIRKAYATYPCGDDDEEDKNMINFQTKDNPEQEYSYDDWGYHHLYSDYGDHPSDYRWSERDNPCHSSYYYQKTHSRNILASDLGILAKRGKDENNIIYVTDILSARPLSGVDLKVYDYQQQVIKTLTTGSGGKAEFTSSRKPFAIIASRGNERAYLKMNDGLSNSLSKFDVSGAGIEKGLNGFIYGERDVWRPGDTLFISFILEDELDKLPDNLPAVCELYTPRGQLYQRTVNNKPVNMVYTFRLHTEAEAETGMWKINLKVGDATFTKYARIETIQPNRLKINLDFKEDHIKRWDITPGELDVSWLHGGTASQLKTETEVTIRPLRHEFKDFKDYSFSDPSKQFQAETFTIHEGKIDKQGKATILPEFNLENAAPGVMNAHFETRVFENGGRSSIHKENYTYYPYRSYAGLRAPGGENWHDPLQAGEENIIELRNVKASGKRMKQNQLRVQVYKLGHSWWYDYSGNTLKRLLNDNSNEAYTEGKAEVNNGKATFNLRINKPDHGRYFIRVQDLNSGHSAGKLVYVSGHKRWMQDQDKDFASLLIFQSDKEKYQAGEKVSLNIPSSKDSKILVSLENGFSVIHSEWIDGEQGETTYSFKTTKEMAPAIYAHITLLQPHAQTSNDLPLRLYGVIPIEVEEEDFILEPKIQCAESFRPESKARISVSEEKGKAMTYTLAIVDEGLLDLTNFKTPDPFRHFYQRKSIGVKTWDLFDYVLGAFDGQINRILSIGGGGYAEIDRDKGEVNRFKPMVRFLGPFKLEKGKTAAHEINIPQYIGSVRIMLVAREQESYGNTEKTVKVKSPLMLLGTLPRVLSPGEEVELPVNVFAMEEDVQSVNVNLQASKIFEPLNNSQKTVSFSETGDKLVNFTLKVKQAVGSGKIEITASSGRHKAGHTIDIKVENPNPFITDVKSALIKPTNSSSLEYEPIGMHSTNTGKVEVSTIPPIDLTRRLEFLIRYPYGCTEQTVSSVFPQLYLQEFTSLTSREQEDITRNIKAGIRSLRRMQQGNGGFSYWPGASYVNDWASSYAGHFLYEASEKGYHVPPDMLSSWYSYQQKQANIWSSSYNRNHRSDLTQAYRLYTLAHYGKPAIGAMNRLRSKNKLEPAASWMLAAAYAKAGQNPAAKALLAKSPEHIKEYEEYSYTFGSQTRDYGIMVQALVLTGQPQKAFSYIRTIAEKLSSEQWLSTQTIAFSLVAIHTYLKNNTITDGINYQISYNGETHQIRENKTISRTTLQGDKKQSVQIKNNSEGNLYVRLLREGQPMENPIEEKQQNLNMTVNYTDMNGSNINPKKLPQGTDFIAEVTVRHPGTLQDYKEIALEQIFPSGWEISGMRLQDGYGSESDSDQFNYQDVRDDRVYTFFNLKKYSQKTFKVTLNASYLGRYYHPVTQCKAMYSDNIFAYQNGYWVEVIKP
ncbi:MAG: MG2 domain-containing protein [Bacteroidales bacterium]